jgi:hypothetical protein
MFAKPLAALAIIASIWALAACSGDPRPAASLQSTETTEQTQPAAPALNEASPEPATPTVDPQAWQPVELPDAGLRLNVPPGWQALEDGGYWSDPSGARLSLSVMSLPANTQASGVFLPEEFDLVESHSFSTRLGLGDYLLISITRQHGQSTTTRYEWHILINNGDHPAVDFYASAASQSVLEQLRPQLERLAQAACWLP